MTTKRTLGQLVIPELLPGSFWVVTQGHGVIPDGRRFLVVKRFGGDYWWSWEDGKVPLHGGTLLKEEHFCREADDDD